MSNLATYQVKFISPAGISPTSAQFLAAELVQNNFHHYDFYVPRFNPKMIIFKYQTADAKTKLLNNPLLNDILHKYNLVPHVPTPSDTIEKAKKTIFVWNLNPNIFFHDSHETLGNKKDQLIADLKARSATKDLHIIHHHFIQPRLPASPNRSKSLLQP